MTLTPIEMVAKMVDGKRVYSTPEGKFYPSITTVISNNAKKQAGLAKWRARVGKDKAAAITARSTKRGTNFHSIVEDYLNKDLDIEEYKESPLPVFMFEQTKKTLDRISNIYLQEAALYSDNLEVAGRVDCIAEYDGKLSIIDFKTSSKERNDEWNENYYIQASAYAEMFEEQTGTPIEQIVILVVTEDGAVQEFIKEKYDYIPLLVETIDNFTKEWEEENDKLDRTG